MTREVPLARRKSFFRQNAPAIFLAGLVMFGVSMILLALLSNAAEETPIRDAHLAVANGTATLTYPLFGYPRPSGYVEGTYSFPSTPGDVLVLGCGDYSRLRGGETPEHPFIRRHASAAGHLRVDHADAMHVMGMRYVRALPRHGDGEGMTGGSPRDPAMPPEPPLLVEHAPFCPALYAMFSWPVANGTSWEENKPLVDLVAREDPLDSPAGGMFFLLSILGAGLTLVGGVSWSSGRGLRGYEQIETLASSDESTAETLMRLAERSGAWLERTRRYLLVSGVLGIFLWYPILIPWAWRVGWAGTSDKIVPWLYAAGVLLFLLALTVLWAREFLRLDRELAAWREKIARLKRREAELLAELQREG